jgi:6-pyruvoyl-tetrahydropterin synthase
VIAGQDAAHMPTAWSATVRTRLGVEGHFSAAHRGPDGQMHGHTWTVRAWFETPGRADARCYRAALNVLLAQWDHTTLPDELAWGEDIAATVLTLCNCVRVEVMRPTEGFYAELERSNP